MTFEEFAKQYMVKNGMWPEDVEEALDSVVKDNNSPLHGRWEDDIKDYPEVMQMTIVLVAKKAALKWIDVNLPQAFFRPLFAEEGK